MNKKLLTLAVAAAVAAPGLASAEAILYGKINMSIDYFDIDNTTFTYEETEVEVDGDDVDAVVVDENGNRVITGFKGKDFKGWTLNGNNGKGAPRANRLGVKGSEDLGNGIKAVYQIELGIPMANENDDIDDGDRGRIQMRNSFVGLATDWGSLLVGRHDTPFKLSTAKLDLFADRMADYNGTVGFDDRRADNVIAYISPNWAGLQFSAAAIPGGASTAFGQENRNSDSLSEGYSLALVYKNGPFYAGAAYEAFGSELLMNTAVSEEGSAQCVDALSCAYADDDYTKWRIGLGLLDWNGFTLTAIYEDQDGLPDGQFFDTTYTYNPATGEINAIRASGPEGQKLWQVQAGYAFGNVMLKGMYGSVTRDDSQVLSATRDTLSINNLQDDLEGDLSTWALGVDYDFSKRTTAYALYTEVSDDQGDDVAGADWSGFSLGIIHSF